MPKRAYLPSRGEERPSGTASSVSASTDSGAETRQARLTPEDLDAVEGLMSASDYQKSIAERASGS